MERPQAEPAKGSHRIAEALGTYPTTKRTVQRDRYRLPFSQTGLESEREVEEFRVFPNVIRDLGPGEAIVWRRLPGRIEHLVIDPAAHPGASVR